VLRTNAASTGSTALRALGGTVIGFAAGALLLLGLGTSTPVLWTALPIAIAVAAYAPGTLPFAVGQAAFTVAVVVLFNVLQPVGWRLGLLRVQDVAMGCAVSLVVGALFWPRGASSVVGDDLADAFRRGTAYLTQAVDWALGTRRDPPDTAAAAVTAGIRLDEALRGFLAEQGAKRLSKEDLWMLVVATMQLRLTSTSLASLQALEPARHRHPDMVRARAALDHDMADLARFYERIAAFVGRPLPMRWCRSVSRRSSASTGTAAPFWLSPLLFIRTCSGWQSACSISARMHRRSPGRPRTWPSSADFPGGGRDHPEPANFDRTGVVPVLIQEGKPGRGGVPAPWLPPRETFALDTGTLLHR
jgi:hypothetical protein